MSRYRIERKTLSEQVAEQLEAEILEGRLSENDQLPSERELMEQFGVGRPAVREALFHLQQLGLIAINSGTRARVIRPTAEAVMARLSGVTRQLLSKPDGQQYFQEARAMFEISLARYAARNASDEDLARLRGALADNRDAIGDEARFKRSDNEFHGVLASIGRNPIFDAIHVALSEWLDDRRAQVLQQKDEDKAATAAHTDIVEAIESRDPDAAEAAMRRHLDRHYGTYMQLKQRLAPAPD
ncbi:MULTISPECIES: transcriptional regulator NanR [unclassified Halomonas]|uniref:transcriptional regulator NanR n=1 Tax=unclassified Halomonas TaxID=2609666 RepID=UPI0006DA88A7|nr:MULTISPECIES: transcriptional regulator NanR [unclassified Halomonas]KPQ22131.1 MAG: GntR family transcriptional regulator, uxuAB operon transcriptional repressor [Halomonas sp. HL-93]SBR46007.1 transcriptional regulator, GntR family [Halomonas sp. HL-93]SNY98551.1 transcriptional regulator, GntR family [Halomonas sp. hl-4]